MKLLTYSSDALAAKLTSDHGTGRAFAILFESGESDQLAASLSTELSKSQRALAIEVPRITPSNWRAISDEVQAIFGTKSIRQVSLVGLGSAGAIAQNIVLSTTRFVRTMVLVDATTRPHPSRMTQVIDRIERALPLGLPLRLKGTHFDSRSLLQRMRCPALIVTSSDASPHIKNEALVMCNAIPTAWSVELPKTPNLVQEVAQVIGDFQQVPARCPQRAQ